MSESDCSEYNVEEEDLDEENEDDVFKEKENCEKENGILTNAKVHQKLTSEQIKVCIQLSFNFIKIRH